jgi:hypothetical protein
MVEAPAFTKEQIATAKEAARLPAPWVNRCFFAVTDSGQLRISFIEVDGVSGGSLARAAVTMSPTQAQFVAEAIMTLLQKSEPAGREN